MSAGALTSIKKQIVTAQAQEDYQYVEDQGRRRTCERQCKHKTSRRISPGHLVGGVWELTLECSSPNPAEIKCLC